MGVVETQVGLATGKAANEALKEYGAANEGRIREDAARMTRGYKARAYVMFAIGVAFFVLPIVAMIILGVNGMMPETGPGIAAALVAIFGCWIVSIVVMVKVYPKAVAIDLNKGGARALEAEYMLDNKNVTKDFEERTGKVVWPILAVVYTFLGILGLWMGSLRLFLFCAIGTIVCLVCRKKGIK